ncbi:Mitochondrial import inner membrane translocase subunit [Plasmodium coatneyi]|uniref:Mitochondrial import inner membrane translocase subunit n=1 Tax=Plasmodium coatneyi TaxID=208452 RepID=A0A1B1DT35_9APIC|nr:Mitochondrial import inner membrane translocase subunit [Plasmodium coatneyi]ANQ05912.1 Mitochondrial import inner membrane translocase subunit [Plasmodium coatneyi]
MNSITPTDDGLDEKSRAAVLLGLQEIVQRQKENIKVMDICFNKCVPKIGHQLSSAEQKCIGAYTSFHVIVHFFVIWTNEHFFYV